MLAHSLSPRRVFVLTQVARQLADELWSEDEDENSELVAGLHTVGGGGASGGTLPLPSWRQPGGASGGASGGVSPGGAVAAAGRSGGGQGAAKRQRKSSQAASVDLF